MEFWPARAMQMAYLDEAQMNRIHILEANLKPVPHCIANFNIQDILGIPPVKETWGIPGGAEEQALHADRIRLEMKKKGFLKTEEEGRPGELRWEVTHAMDWAVFNRNGEILWSYQGGGGRRGAGRLKQMIRQEYGSD